jgi:hypothetical protein
LVFWPAIHKFSSVDQSPWIIMALTVTSEQLGQVKSKKRKLGKKKVFRFIFVVSLSLSYNFEHLIG